MNEVIQAIKKRRSIRSYDSRAIPRTHLNVIIEAANEAPSAINSQPWRFVVIEDDIAKKKLLNAARPNAGKVFDMIKDSDPERYEMIKKRHAELPDPIYYSAPAIVFVIGSGRYAAHSCPLACENMMLAAHSLGIGSCWVGFGSMVTDDAEVRKMLELKDDETIFGPILLGYAASHPDRPPKKDPVIKWI
ncbi:MAG TPA: nitroreductase family protein [Dissulfurispiraceae bacterium]|nr:nitroreductase family protein [Dissulfurispiraceae bacterium]